MLTTRTDPKEPPCVLDADFLAMAQDADTELVEDFDESIYGSTQKELEEQDERNLAPAKIELEQLAKAAGTDTSADLNKLFQNALMDETRVRTKAAIRRAVAVYRYLCMLGDHHAMVRLAGLIMEGKTTDGSNDETAFALYREAARLGNVTFWAKFTEEPDGYTVRRVYSHRMTIETR